MRLGRLNLTRPAGQSVFQIGVLPVNPMQRPQHFRE
jgi:hypothetical protein